MPEDSPSEYDVALATAGAPSTGGEDFQGRLEDELLRAGLSFEHATRATEICLDLVAELSPPTQPDREARELAAALKLLLLKLEATPLMRTPGGVALKRVVIGDEGRSLTDDANALGITKQSLYTHVSLIRKALAY